MYCYCRDEFDWLMKIIEKGNCFSDYEDLNDFIDDGLLKLRYMKKRFGYLFFDHHKYIKKVNGRNAIFVNKEHQYVCRKPEEPTYHEGYENKSYTTIPMEDTERYDIKYLDEIDRGDPFITSDDKYQDECVKDTKNILQKIMLVKPEIYNSSDFYEVLCSNYFDNIELEKDVRYFYNQVKKYVIDLNIKDIIDFDDQYVTVEEGLKEVVKMILKKMYKQIK